MKKKTRILSLFVVIALLAVMLPVPAQAIEEPTTAAASAVLIDAVTGDVLYQKNGDMTMFPGGLTMLMTALLVAEAVDVERVSLSERVVASETYRYNLSEGCITADPAIVPGESLTVEELLYCSLLSSAADACNILAERVGGSAEEFVESMNRRASELGCTNTHFANANGQPVTNGQQHYTTAHDLAFICRQLVTKKSILDVSRAASYTLGATEVAGSRTVYNANYLLDPSSEFYYQQAYGLKTGYSAELGNCLVAAADYNDVNVVAVILGCPVNGDQFRDAMALFDWAFENYSYRQILNPYDTLDTVKVIMGNPDTIGVRAENTISMLLPNDQQLGTIEYRLQYTADQTEEGLEAPISAGESLGSVTVLVDGVEHGSSRLVAAATSDISRMDYLQSQLRAMMQAPSVQQIFKILFIVVAIYIVLLLVYGFQRMNHLRTLRKARRDRARTRAHQEAKWLEVPQEELEGGPAGYFDGPEEYDLPERNRNQNVYFEQQQEEESYGEEDPGYQPPPENREEDKEDDFFSQPGRHEVPSPRDTSLDDFDEDL